MLIYQLSELKSYNNLLQDIKLYYVFLLLRTAGKICKVMGEVMGDR